MDVDFDEEYILDIRQTINLVMRVERTKRVVFAREPSP